LALNRCTRVHAFTDPRHDVLRAPFTLRLRQDPCGIALTGHGGSLNTGITIDSDGSDISARAPRDRRSALADFSAIMVVEISAPT
jgi:hypothetical protein